MTAIMSESAEVHINRFSCREEEEEEGAVFNPLTVRAARASSSPTPNPLQAPGRSKRNVNNNSNINKIEKDIVIGYDREARNAGHRTTAPNNNDNNNNSSESENAVEEPEGWLLWSARRAYNALVYTVVSLYTAGEAGWGRRPPSPEVINYASSFRIATPRSSSHTNDEEG